VLVLLMARIREVRSSDDLRWHVLHTKFHDDRFRNSTNMNSITSIIPETAVLLLLVREIYDVSHRDRLRCCDIHAKFHNDRLMNSCNNKGISETI
jgi:DNA-binding GntR family transcriptional regulator